MFKWLNRRLHIRREKDQQDKLEKAVADKQQMAEDSMRRLNQFTLDRRTSGVMERRKA